LINPDLSRGIFPESEERRERRMYPPQANRRLFLRIAIENKQREEGIEIMDGGEICVDFQEGVA
jgi:hypothetical protein